MATVAEVVELESVTHGSDEVEGPTKLAQIVFSNDQKVVLGVDGEKCLRDQCHGLWALNTSSGNNDSPFIHI